MSADTASQAHWEPGNVSMTSRAYVSYDFSMRDTLLNSIWCSGWDFRLSAADRSPRLRSDFGHFSGLGFKSHLSFVIHFGARDGI